jgi:hypothetical protein
MKKSIAAIAALAVALTIGISSPASAATPDPVHADVCIGNVVDLPCQVHISALETFGSGVAALCAGVPEISLVNFNPQPPVVVPGVGSIPFGAFVSLCKTTY